MWPFKKPEPWIYLGWSELKWSDANSDYVHFYAKGEDLSKRKVESLCNKYVCSRHRFYEKFITPWLADSKSNIWKPIENPSESLKIWTEQKNGYLRVDNLWVKPAPDIEQTENVITFPKSK